MDFRTQLVHLISSLMVIGLFAGLLINGNITSAEALGYIGLVVGQLLGIQGFALGTSTAALSVPAPLPVPVAAPVAAPAPIPGQMGDPA